MADINIEKLKEKLYSVAKALFMISETLVDESKCHISKEDALKKICSYMHDADVICSRYRVDKLIEECMEPMVSKVLDDKQTEWVREYLGKWNVIMPEINYPSCCDGCSNDPKNGGSGICNCTLPYMQNPIMYSAEDQCMANNTSGNVYFVTNTDSLQNSKSNDDRIAEAVERIEKYLR